MANALTTTVIANKKRKAFLVALAITGVVKTAAEAAGYQTAGALLKYRREDEDFAEEWANALESATSTLQDEAIRRARDGVLEDVWHKGEVVGEKLVYSDQLLMFVLKGLKPSTYRDNSRGGDMNINFGVAVIPMVAENDEAWEKRAVKMHGQQKTITLEAKPVENNLKRVKRGD